MFSASSLVCCKRNVIFYLRYETIDRSGQNIYNDTYSNLTSPEKVNSLERSKKEKTNLISEINALDSAVYGGTNSYGQNSMYQTNLSPKSHEVQNGSSKFENQSYEFSQKSDFSSYESPKFSQTFKPVTPPESKYFPKSPIQNENYKTESSYYNYQSSKPIEEKGFSSTPITKIYGTASNGTSNDHSHQLMSTFSSNVDYTVNEPPMISEIDNLEQRMCKQSITQKIIEKKTVHMTSSSKQESSTKSYRFE